MRQVFKELEVKMDTLMVGGRVPHSARNGWNIGKNVVKKARDATSFLETAAIGVSGRNLQ